MNWSDSIRRRRNSAYAAGPRLDQALDVSRRLATFGVRSAIGYSASPDEPARRVADLLLTAIDRITSEALDCYVSVKLSGLGFDAVLFAELATAARRTGQRLHIDSLSPDTADPTLLLLATVPDAGGVGMTLPGRWRRSTQDASRMFDGGRSIRVVKGQWADDVDESLDPIQGFLEIVDRLCGRGSVVAVATHDDQLLAESLQRLVETGTACEAELLFGWPFRRPAIAAQRLGVPIRVYVPFGHTGSPYGLTDVLTSPMSTSWLVQDLLLGNEKTWRSIHRWRRDP